jgi:signal transduction histidine kinase
MEMLENFRRNIAKNAGAVDESLMENQGKVSRSLINVTLAHRHLAQRQFVVQQIAYWITVLGLLVAEASAPVLNSTSMWIWLGVSVGTWIVRVSLFWPLTQLPPAVVKKSLWLKLIPLSISVIACLYWIWTIKLFAGPVLTVRELIMCIGLLSISVSMTGMWPVTPLAVVIYNSVLWGAFSISLYANGVASFPVIVALDVGVLAVLWLNIFIAIRQLNDQLERTRETSQLVVALETANSKLERLKDTAYKTLDTRSEFFAGASHDFQQRLHAAKLWVLSAMAATKANQSAESTLDRLGQEVDALQVYINNILEFARIESLDAGVKIRATEIQSLFQKLDLHFEKIAEQNGVQLRFRMARITIGTDASMLLRMLENLVSNALKYTKGGVLVCARKTSRGVSIEVWDQGNGIKPEAQQRIFDAFHQEDSGDQGRAKGVGLGLAIVKRFAARLSYRIEVKSVMGRGTLFRILIPREFVIGTVSSD